MENSQDFFGKAMGNFMHEMSGAGAIRHMVDQGYSIRQIMERLDYPTPQCRVEETALKHMLKQGILLESLPNRESLSGVRPEQGTRTEQASEAEETMINLGYRRTVICRPYDRKQISEAIYSRRERDGEASSYVRLPLSKLKKDREFLPCLSGRERDYLCGLPWKGGTVYHRLTGRMYEIAMELAMAVGNAAPGLRDNGIEYAGLDEIRFYFIKSCEEVVVIFNNEH